MSAAKSYRLSPIARLNRRLGDALLSIASMLPEGDAIRGTRGTQVPVTATHWFHQKVLGVNGEAYWPMHPSSDVTHPQRIRIGVETSPGHGAGCRINGLNGIAIGDYTQISQNVAILSANHDPLHLPRHLSSRPIRIGRYCLLGFGCVILPGVELGDYTIVGANSVVRHSVPEGYAVLAGAPAKVVRWLKPSSEPDFRSPREYHGYIRADRFTEFCRSCLDLPDELQP